MAKQSILVADRVEYGLDSFGKMPQTWRVTHHLRKQTISEYYRAYPAKDFPSRYLRKLNKLDETRVRKERRKQGLPAHCRYRLIYCRPNQATHVSLVCICGTTAPINKCKKLGTVNWTREMILQSRREAVNKFWLANDFSHDWHWE